MLENVLLFSWLFLDHSCCFKDLCVQLRGFLAGDTTSLWKQMVTFLQSGVEEKRL